MSERQQDNLEATRAFVDALPAEQADELRTWVNGMSDHEQTRQAVAKAIYRAWHNIPAKGSDRFDDPTLYPGTRELAGRMADAAIAVLEPATPGPAVSEAESVEAWERTMFLNALRHCVEHGIELPRSTPSMRAGVLEKHGIVLAARTTARAPEPYEPTEAEVDRALARWRATEDERALWDDCGAGAEAVECWYRNRMRETLIAARNAGEGA